MAQNVNEIGDMSHILLASNITSGQVTQTWEAILLNSGTRSRNLNNLESQGSGKMLYAYYLSDLSFMHFVLILWIDVLISHHVAKSQREWRAWLHFTTPFYHLCSVVWLDIPEAEGISSSPIFIIGLFSFDYWCLLTWLFPLWVSLRLLCSFPRSTRVLFIEGSLMQFCQVNERMNGLQSDTSDTLIVPLFRRSWESRFARKATFPFSWDEWE